jgi:hypothetical protein
MSANTPDQQITYPIGTDLADNPTAFLDMLADVEQRLSRQYTTVADRLARMLALAENQVSSLSTENRLDVYDGANHVSLAARSHNNFLFRTADAAAINNSTVLVPDAVLTAPVVPTGNATYLLEANVFYTCSTAADIKFTLNVPTVITMRWAGWGLGPTVTTTVGDIKIATVTASGTTDDWAGIGTGTTATWKLSGYLTTATTGNIVLAYAQQTANATDLTVRTGSWLRVTRVS